MSRFLNAIFWVSILSWVAFMLMVIALGALEVLGWGKKLIWLWPILSLAIFIGVVTLKGLRPSNK